ncbi:YrhK family protein [Amycolatopsis sp. H20-H5]|uniref:YrhK family protein n=1 Tax=Amycolatopsis sp. H20-H5 TaxID=3046309 RepID=UPI002DB71F00|nr:YrhK family protein [Amycolatopsis sp. H20-H5]MEC3975832.1 YrhK family protein [Amycolatopsis sp. H20-H5]
MTATPESRSPLVLTFGHDELVIRRRYEALSIVNDILIAMWFVVGSILFFFGATTTAGTWFFLVGSVELLIRPGIRLTRTVHLRRIQGEPTFGASTEF